METKIILITGAGQGIGYAIAKAVASSERTLLLADLNAETLNKAVEELKPSCSQVIPFVGDLTDREIRTEMVEDILDEFGHIDVLVNNAGVTHTVKPLEDITEEEYDFNFRVNTKLPFQLMKAFLPQMKERNNGLIINMSSSANISGYQDLSVYSATKAALSSLTDSVAQETQGTGITAIAIMPSRTNTPMQVKVRGEAVAQASQSPDFVASVIAKIVNGEIPVHNGDDVRIKEGKFLVEEDIFSKEF